MRSPRLRWVVLLAACVSVAAITAEAQLRRGRSFSNLRVAAPEDFDGTFQFCRVVFRNGPNGDYNSGSWEVDFPRADINLSIRLSELTKTRVGRDKIGRAHV